MERSGVTLQVAGDASDLVDLAEAGGPFLTLQLTTEADIDNATQRSEQRWRAVRDEAAAQGAPAEVLDAVDPMAMAAVDVLLIAADDPDDPRNAWFGPEPTQLTTTAAEVRRMGVDQPTEGRLVDVAVRAAQGTRARIWVAGAGAGLEGGIGAILRWNT